jgi:antitoxin (DNA-binding transcriptional repressor) of toxin-antitoxin stability system
MTDAELARNFLAACDAVQHQGETILITRAGITIARFMPMDCEQPTSIDDGES